MKRFTSILLVAVTALALIGSPRITAMSNCSPLEAAGSTNWCAQ